MMNTTLGPDSVMQRSIESKVRPVLDLMNNLRCVCLEYVFEHALAFPSPPPLTTFNKPIKYRKIGIEKEFSIPQIAVMGDQSSGKSSVLEAISSIPFPRGSGMPCDHFILSLLLLIESPPELRQAL